MRASFTPTSTARPRGGGEVQGGRRGLRGPLRPGAPPHLRHVRARGAALGRLRPRGDGSGGFEDILSRVLRRRATRRSATSSASAGRGPGSRRRRRRRCRDRARRRPDGRRARGLVRGGLPLRALPRQRRRARHADPHLRDVRRRRAPSSRSRARRSARWCGPAACPTCNGEGKIPDEPCETCDGAGRIRRASGPARSTSRPGSRTASGSASQAPATRASTAPRRRPLRRGRGSRDDDRFERQGEHLVTAARIGVTRAMLGGTIEVPTLDGTARSRCPKGAQPGQHVVAPRARACPRSRGRQPRRPARASSTSSSRDRSSNRKQRARRRGARRAARRAASGRRMIRLAVRCRPEQAELVLAELVAARARRGRGGAAAPAGSSTRSTAPRASCPTSARSRRRPATGWSRSRSEPRSPTTGPTAGATSTSRVIAGGAWLVVRHPGTATAPAPRAPTRSTS